MAQTVVAMSGVNALVYLSDDGSTWTNVSGSANQVAATEQRRASGEGYTFDGDTAILKAGKREPLEVTVRALYTESATESFEVVKELFETVGGGPCWVKWMPSGTATARAYDCASAVVTRFTYPPADATDPNPVAVEFSFRCKQVDAYHGGVPLSEWQGLKDFYDDMDGANWDTATNWLDDDYDVTDWYGVTVTTGHVTAIELADNGLDGELDTSWGAKLPYLATLDVSDNALGTADVDSIVTAIYTNRLVFTAPDTLDISGDNDPPTGTVQAPSPCPAANCGEMAYELVNDSCSTGHEKWTAVTI